MVSIQNSFFLLWHLPHVGDRGGAAVVDAEVCRATLPHGDVPRGEVHDGRQVPVGADGCHEALPQDDGAAQHGEDHHGEFHDGEVHGEAHYGEVLHDDVHHGAEVPLRSGQGVHHELHEAPQGVQADGGTLGSRCTTLYMMICVCVIIPSSV